jgi:hypothetical protein
MGAARDLNQHFQYLFDAKGEKSHVVVPMNFIEELVEDLEDARDIKKGKKEPTMSLADFEKELMKDGKL